jgi:hypothetical protein
MAKRKAKAGTRKSARRTSKAALRKRPKSVRKAAPRKRTKAKTTRRASASARRATKGKKAIKLAARTRGSKGAARKAAAKKAPAARQPATSRKPSRTMVAARPKPAALQRERRQLREDETVPGPPSTLGYSPKASSAESGQAMYTQRKREHTEGGPALTAGDIDTDWNDAYSSGEETPGGDMPTPDQDVVDEIGRALGVEYEDAEELKGSEKIEERDKHRWEYDPASAEDYRDRTKKQ